MRVDEGKGEFLVNTQRLERKRDAFKRVSDSNSKRRRNMILYKGGGSVLSFAPMP